MLENITRLFKRRIRLEDRTVGTIDEVTASSDGITITARLEDPEILALLREPTPSVSIAYVDVEPDTSAWRAPNLSPRMISALAAASSSPYAAGIARMADFAELRAAQLADFASQALGRPLEHWQIGWLTSALSRGTWPTLDDVFDGRATVAQWREAAGLPPELRPETLLRPVDLGV